MCHQLWWSQTSPEWCPLVCGNTCCWLPHYTGPTKDKGGHIPHWLPPPPPLPSPAPPVPPHSSPLQQNCINMSALSCCSTRQTTVFQVCHNDNARQSKWLVVVISPTARTTCLYCDCWIIPLYVGSVLLLAGHALVSLFLEKLPPTWMVKDR